VKEAEQFAAEDAKVKESVETRNSADQMVYQAEKTLSEMGDKISADDKAKVQSGIDNLKEKLKGEDTAAIKSATEELTQAFYAVSEKLYQTSAPQGDPNMGGSAGAGAAGGDQGGQQYYDADYKVVDDDQPNQ
jgi:molecular chaperone DnaK